MDRHLIKAFEAENIQLFIGSGLSHGIYDSARKFCRKLLEEKITTSGIERTLEEILAEGSAIPTTPIENTYSLSDIAEFYELYDGSQALLEIVKKTFGKKRNSTETHNNLWKLPGVRLIYTTNYDCLIEGALRSPLIEPVVATRLSELKDIHPDKRIVFKPHGCAYKSTERADFVITRTDYLNYSRRRILEELKTLYDIFTRTFLFLGYSLEDHNIRQIITEANRIEPNIRAYAVLKDISVPEVRYWEDRFNLKVIRMSAEQFVSNAIRLFPPDTSEWARKITTRINEKEKIANIGVDIIRAEIVRSGNEGLNIIIDSGTTCLFLIKSFLRKIEENRIMHLTTEMKKEEDYSTALYGSATNKCKEIFFDISNITIITNSAPAVAAISEDIRALNQGLQLFSTGGLLKLSTQALILEKKMSYKDLEQFLEGQAKKRRTISFVGATAFDRNNLKTKTLDEVTAKQQFISHSNTAYILVDHSKPRNVTEDDYTFSPIDTSRMIFITDQKKEMEGFQEFTVIDSGHDVRQLFGKVREE